MLGIDLRSQLACLVPHQKSPFPLIYSNRGKNKGIEGRGRSQVLLVPIQSPTQVFGVGGTPKNPTPIVKGDTFVDRGKGAKRRRRPPFCNGGGGGGGGGGGRKNSPAFMQQRKRGRRRRGKTVCRERERRDSYQRRVLWIHQSF